MRINWFSPTVETETTTYTQQILPTLSKQAEITLYSDKIINSTWREINQAKLNIYLLGKEIEIHQPIYKISSQAPGLIIVLGGEWAIETARGILTHNQAEYQQLVKEKTNFLLAYNTFPQEEDIDNYSKDLLSFAEKVVKIGTYLTTANLLLKRITPEVGIWNNPIVFDEEIESIAKAIDFLCN